MGYENPSLTYIERHCHLGNTSSKGQSSALYGRSWAEFAVGRSIKLDTFKYLFFQLIDRNKSYFITKCSTRTRKQVIIGCYCRYRGWWSRCSSADWNSYLLLRPSQDYDPIPEARSPCRKRTTSQTRHDGSPPQFLPSANTLNAIQPW